jgi:hypothetical protein
MKKLFAFVLLMALTAQTFSRGITLLNFYMNRAYITRTQCVNRNRPMMHCNGQCVLAKKLKQQEKKEQQNSELKLQGKLEVASSRSFFLTHIEIISISHIKYLIRNCSTTVDRSASVFHPPCL